MSTPNDGPSFRARVLGGEPLFGTFVGMGSTVSAEICAQAGFDWLLFDLEHGAGTESELLPQMLAASPSGVGCLVRVESNARLRISRVLDLGATGVMVPRVDTRDDALAAVGAWRYPPDGTRGVALMTRAGGYGSMGHQDVAPRNEAIVGIVQIESMKAVEGAAAIAAVPGVDVLFVGPTDLSHDMGIPGRFQDARYVEAQAHVAKVASAAGKVAGILVRKAEEAETALSLGYRFIGLGSDGSFLASSSRAAAAELRQIAGQAR